MTIERIPITGRDQWLALRANDVTASDVAAVCGEGMYGSAARVWASKKGLLPAQEMTDAMKRGHWGEAAVFEAIAWEYPDWELRRAKVYLRDVAARLGATPDGAAIVPGRDGLVVVQCKVIAAPIFRNEWLLDPKDDIQHGDATVPLGYQLQTLTEAMLGEAGGAVVAALVVDTFKWVLRLFWIDRHPAAETMIRDKVTAFWTNYLDTDLQPPIEPARDAELVKLLYPADDGTEIDLRGDNELPAMVNELDDLKRLLKDGGDRRDEIETAIKGKLGQHTYGRLVDGRMVSWKLQQRKGYEVAPTSYRVLRIAKGKAA